MSGLEDDIEKYVTLTKMEKAILETLVYADLFDYPLKAWEIHKWLIGKEASLPQVEKVLKRKSLVFRIKNQEDYYFLKGRNGIVRKRMRREKQSAKFLKLAALVSRTFRLIPGVSLVGVSGNLAMENAEKTDDIDLFIITEKGKLWTARLGILSVLAVLGKRRKKGQIKELSGKFCLNLLLSEDKLSQKNKDLYTAHEVLQMRMLWQKDNTYSKFLEENEWVFKFLPNWRSGEIRKGSERLRKPVRQTFRLSDNQIFRVVLSYSEKMASWLQMRYMGKPQGKERVFEGELYFHPEDYREDILAEFKKRCDKVM